MSGDCENGVRPSYSDRLTIQDYLTVQYTENNGSLVVTKKFFHSETHMSCDC